MSKVNSKEEIYKQIKDVIENEEGFIKHNNIEIDELKDGYAKIHANLTAQSLNHVGIAHGGLIFGLADTVMGMAACTTGRNVITINSQIDYLKPCTGKKIIAESEILKIGKTTAVLRANIYNDAKNLCASVTGTYFFIDDDK